MPCIFSLKKVENLGYYDFLSYVGVPFFHTGGLKASLELAGLCHVNKDKKVLMVGCGAGLSACFLAKRLGCHVIGIDIANVSINKARERARQELLEGQTEFYVGDAHNLPFESGIFDAVMTEFVSMFLDKSKAFKEFARVLKPGGYLGINELFKAQDIPPHLADKILSAEEFFQEATKMAKFGFYTPNDWSRWMEDAGLKNVQVNGYPNAVDIIGLPEYKDGVKIDKLPEYVNYAATTEPPEFTGGFSYLRRFLGLSFNRKKIVYLMLSKPIRNRFKKYIRFRKIIFEDTATSNYVGHLFGIGQRL